MEEKRSIWVTTVITLVGYVHSANLLLMMHTMIAYAIHVQSDMA
ncbi:MAG: hypothetical protein ACK4FV_04715 [Candidatus Nitrosocaldus sp.]